MSDIHERIIAQTERLGISGKVLGQKLGLKKTPLTDWKNKKSCPTLEQVIMMCEIFSVSSDYLIFGKSSLPSADENKLLTKSSNDLDTDEIEFLENFKNIAEVDTLFIPLFIMNWKNRTLGAISNKNRMKNRTKKLLQIDFHPTT